MQSCGSASFTVFAVPSQALGKHFDAAMPATASQNDLAALAPQRCFKQH
jgi:hypothetical protein